MAIQTGEIVVEDMTGAEIRDALLTLGPTERGFISTNPASGEFKIVGVRRNAGGNMEYDYDDVATP